MIKGKKGNFQDVPEVIIGAVFFFFFLVIMLLVWSQWNAGIQAQNDSVIPSLVKTGADNTFNIFKFIADFIIPVILLGSFVFSVMAARLIPSSPKFFIVSVLYLIILPLIMMAVHNIVDSFTSNLKVAGFLAGNLPITGFLLSHLVHVTVIYSVVVAIAILTKNDVGVSQ